MSKNYELIVLNYNTGECNKHKLLNYNPDLIDIENIITSLGYKESECEWMLSHQEVKLEVKSDVYCYYK